MEELAQEIVAGEITFNQAMIQLRSAYSGPIPLEENFQLTRQLLAAVETARTQS